MSKTSNARTFLENMNQGTEEVAPAVFPSKARHAKGNALPGTRQGLKHIGGYLAPETVERVAILRARLNLDNSELIKLAIDELYNRQKAKRAFND